MAITVPLPAQGDTSWYDWAADIDGQVRGAGAGAVGMNGRLAVVGLQAPTALRDYAATHPEMYVCDGVGDEVQINAALLRAARPNDVAGGEGYIGVDLIGHGPFRIAAPIKVLPATELRGQGPGTQVDPQFSNTATGAVEVYSATTDKFRVTNFSIGKINSSTMQCGGLRFMQSTSTGDAYEMDTGNDAFWGIDRLFIHKPAGKGVEWVTGREVHCDQVVVWDSAGVGFQISGSDSKISRCTAQTQSAHGFAVAGGNTKLMGCKAYYTDGSGDGYYLTSSRAEVDACAAQDCGRWGLNSESSDCRVTGFTADSNQRVDATGGGVRIAGTGLYSALNVFDRAQSAQRQTRGISIASAFSDLYLTGRVGVPSGTEHVVGSTPAAGSYVRVVRVGSTLYSIG